MDDGLMFFHIEGNGTGVLEDDSSSRSFRTDGVGIFLCRAGRARIMIDGTPYEVGPKQFGVVFPQSLVEVVFRSEDLDAIVVRVDVESIQPVLNRMTDIQGVMRMRESPTCVMSDDDYDVMQQYVRLLFRLREMQYSYSQQGDGRRAQLYEQQSDRLREAVALHVVSVVATSGGPRPGLNHKDTVVTQFMNDLHTHFRVHHDVGYYADLQCISSRYFSVIIRERTLRTPSQWITAFLLEESKYLLSGTAWSVKQVADELHFPNQSYFGKWFREKVGISPAGWKRGKPLTANHRHVDERGPSD